MKKPAFFLDRDGVLTVEKGHISTFDQLEVFPYIKTCIEKIHNAGFWAIVITNQSAIARGILEESELIRMNDFLIQKMMIDSVYYCPHYFSTKIKVSKHNKVCRCRKPNIELVERAVRDYNIALDNSYLVGDRETDILTGINAGIKTILLESGFWDRNKELDVQPDYIFKDLQIAVESIIKSYS